MINLSNRIKVDFYMHESKNSGRRKGEEIGLSGEALEYFRYVGYEIKLNLEVDKDTGETWITGVEDNYLKEKVRILKGVE